MLTPFLWLLLAASPAAPACDLLLTGGRVVDGTGAPWFRADVCVVADRIDAVGHLPTRAARRRIDAAGLVIAPGFIDMLGQSEYSVLVDGRAASKITQGITTEITGEGGSIAPLNARMLAEGREVFEHYGVTPNFTTLAGYFAEFERRGAAINLGTFVGAGGVRNLVIGRENRAATPAELEAMKAAVAQAMEEGALGLSTSLIYVPDIYASTEEIIALARVAARYGGSYITHQRNEDDTIDQSLDEVFRIAREAAVPAEIYHLKTAGKRNFGEMPAVLKRIEAARAQGLDVTADQYPWTASSNGLDASLPVWVREGGAGRMVARLRDPVTRARARQDFLKEYAAEWPEYAERVLITSVLEPALKGYEGKTVAQIAQAEGKDPLDVIMDVVIADKGNTGRVTFSMSEEDVRAALAHPLVSFCTDSGARAEDGVLSREKSHPRAWASAPRILGKYVREEKLLTLEEAVRKMTSLPASRMRLHDRGVVRPGMKADLVAFDPERVRERSTYADPNRYSEGIPYVAVNGVLVVDEGRITAARPGRILRGPGHGQPLASQIAVITGIEEDGTAGAIWLDLVRRRRPEAVDDAARVRRPLDEKERAWAELIRSRAAEWPARLPPLVELFAPVHPPAAIRVVLGNRGAEDGFTHDPVTIGFDLSKLASLYGEAGSAENRDRIDRLFVHEYVHLLQKAWLPAHAQPQGTPFEWAEIETWTEGLGNFYSMSDRWRASAGAPSADARAALERLEPLFVERMEALACATPEEAARLTADLSNGPFARKWGALTAALWLEQETSLDPRAARDFVQAGAAGIRELARRHLSPERFARLERARAKSRACDTGRHRAGDAGA